MSDRKRLLTDLRVIDLRAELEKRNLDKSGVRGVLIQRLSKYLEDEGHDPTTYRFDLGSESKVSPTKRTRRSESTVEAENEETPTMEGMIVQDDAGDDDEPETSQEPAAEPPAASDADTATAASNRKREHQQEPEPVEPKKPCLDKDIEIKLENNIDTEDSINLDIGDDELLNEETDTTVKIKKDVDAGNEDSSEAARNEAAPDGSATASDSTTRDQQVNAEAAATSNDDEKPDVDHKDGDKKDKKEEGKEGGARNLWVSGLSGDTRAKDLKQLCSKHGKVIGAKVVTNARTPGSRCYGYVTMATAHDAENCIKNLHRTELHGRMISVEKAKSESESASRRQPSRNERRSSKDCKDDTKENDDSKDDNKKKDGAESNRSTSRTREKSHRSDKDRTRRSTRSRERRRSPREVLSFSKIWQKERDVHRMRERTRVAREEERRRRAAEEALRERERRQRQEKHRLALEREKLRAEREKIEREKNELLRLERERHRLEREKLELERLELKRAQLRLEEERRKRGYENSSYRKPAASPPPEPAYDRERHKRAPPPPLTSSRGQFEAPPPPRFEMSSSYDRGAEKREREYKREYPRHVSSGNMKYPTNGNANEESRQPMPPGTRPKEPSNWLQGGVSLLTGRARAKVAVYEKADYVPPKTRSYESRDGRSYRPSPPGKPEPRSWNASSRFSESAPASKGGSGGGGGGEQWAGGEARYGAGGSGAYEARYQPAYQPPPPGAPYPDRYAPTREYRKY